MTYVPQLDGLRGIAILAVMIVHAKLPILKGAFLGVDIFFVLSGFLISSLLVQEYDRRKSISLRNFYIRRALRLGPALLAFLAVFCLISIVALSEAKAMSNLGDALIALFYLSNWARAFNINPLDFLGHTWSLSIEEQFYIIWPFFLLTLLRSTENRWHIVAVAFAIAIASWALRCYLTMNNAPLVRVSNGLDTRADALMIGCALGVMLSSGLLRGGVRELVTKCLAVSTPISVVLLFVFFAYADWRAPGIYFMNYWGFFVVELLTASLVLDIFLNQGGAIRNALAARWLVWVGSISYGVYLWHYPVFRSMFLLGFGIYEVALFGSLAAFTIAAISFYFLEKPMLKRKERFSRLVPDDTPQPKPAASVA